METPIIWHDGSLRCLSCIALVKLLAEVGDQYLEDDFDDIPGQMDRKKVSRFPKRKRKYEPDSLCSMCKNQIGSGQYHQLSNHLLEAHKAIGVAVRLPSEGCCWLCLLVLQCKCQSGTLNSMGTLSVEDNQPPLYLGLSWFWSLQVFSSSIDEPVRIDQYLPQGIQRKEKDSIQIVPWKKVCWPTVKSWLQTCEDEHTECNQQPQLLWPFAMAENRIFIDVKHLNLVYRQVDCRYAALSYVWGGVPQLLLKKSNKEALFREESLKNFKDSIPQVIRDAIQVVVAIGEELLWVDSLCIVQDDDLFKDQLISEMAAIYSDALVTIVAVEGKNANSSLAGVRENSREAQEMVSIPGTGLSVTCWTPLEVSLDRSTYNTRGWTFQERLLARRCLYFTATQVFLECPTHLISEDRTGRQEGPYPKSNRAPQSGNIFNRMLLDIKDSKDKNHILIPRYSKLVEAYFQRELTFPHDVLKAFAGIEAVFKQELLGWTMVYGLPLELMDYALLWEPGRPRGAQDTTNPARYFNAKLSNVSLKTAAPLQVRTSGLPSWSWAAWIGDICYDEWSSANLQVLHSPFKLVYPTDKIPGFHTPLNERPKYLALGFTSECLPGSKFSLRHIITRDKQTCLIRGPDENDVGTIPGVQAKFEEAYKDTSADIVLLSASNLALHRFRSLEDMGYPSVFDIRYSRDEGSIYTVMFVKVENGYAKRLALGYIHRDAWKEAGPTVKDILLA